MTASEEDITRDTNERNNLQRAISDLETAIAVSNPGTRRILEASLDGVKARVSTLDKKIEVAKVERAAEVQAQAAVAAALAAKETKLSANEQETYRGFLEESYFTKKDFGKLDEFYTHGYDRLSEDGKEEMSKRFWAGVKQGEYQFGDAPSSLQQKEAERAKSHLGLDALSAKELGGMSKEEQRSFAEAYNSNDETEAKRVLARNSVGRSGGNDPETPTVARLPTKEQPPTVVAEIDLSAVDLKNVQLADATPVTAASIPSAADSRVNGR